MKRLPNHVLVEAKTVIDGTVRCTGCMVRQPVEQFGIDGRYTDGRRVLRCYKCKTAVARAWQRANADKERERIRQARKRDPERAREQTRRNLRNWRANNAEKHRQRSRQWRKDNPAKAREIGRRSQLVRKGVMLNGRITEQQWQERLAEFGGWCAYCQQQPADTMDHMDPIDNGRFPDAHQIENIVPACRSCNSRKRNRTVLEWVAAISLTTRTS